MATEALYTVFSLTKSDIPLDLFNLLRIADVNGIDNFQDILVSEKSNNGLSCSLFSYLNDEILCVCRNFLELQDVPLPTTTQDVMKFPDISDLDRCVNRLETVLGIFKCFVTLERFKSITPPNVGEILGFLNNWLHTTPDNAAFKSLDIICEQVIQLLNLNTTDIQQQLPDKNTCKPDDRTVLKCGLAGYEEALLRTIQGFGTNKWNFASLTLLLDYSYYLCLPVHLNALIDVLKDAIAVKDIRVQDTYFKVFKATLLNLSWPDRQKCFEHYFDLYGLQGFAEGVEKYKSELVTLANTVVAESDASSNESDRLAEQLCFLCFITPKNVMWRAFQTILETPKTVPVWAEALSKLTAVCHYREKRADNVANAAQPTLLVVGLKRVVDQGLLNAQCTQLSRSEASYSRTSLTNHAEEPRSEIVSPHFHNRLNMSQKERAYLEFVQLLITRGTLLPEEFMRFIVIPSITLKPDTLHLQRFGLALLQCTMNCAPKALWAGHADGGRVQSATVLCMVLRILMHVYKQKELDKNLSLCFDMQLECLQTLVALKENFDKCGLLLSAKDIEWVFSETSDAFDSSSTWSLHVFTGLLFLHNIDGSVLLPVPKCLMNGLNLSVTQFTEISCGDHAFVSPFVCMTEALFEVCALSDVCLKYFCGAVREKLATVESGLATISSQLWNILAERLPYWSVQSWRNVLGVLQCVLPSADFPVRSFSADRVSTKMYQGLQHAKPLLTMLETMVLIFTEKTNTPVYRGLLSHVERAFSLIVKEHVEMTAASAELENPAKACYFQAVFIMTCAVAKETKTAADTTASKAVDIWDGGEISTVQLLLRDLVEIMARHKQIAEGIELDAMLTSLKETPDGGVKKQLLERVQALQ